MGKHPVPAPANKPKKSMMTQHFDRVFLTPPQKQNKNKQKTQEIKKKQRKNNNTTTTNKQTNKKPRKTKTTTKNIKKPTKQNKQQTTIATKHPQMSNPPTTPRETAITTKPSSKIIINVSGQKNSGLLSTHKESSQARQWLLNCRQRKQPRRTVAY